ncbi:zinc finger protein 557-like isoform X2 [Littorina saxatilis]|uniref:zinc finger protein 557-like isoform X2 n=1 Tax=Littorina saxatilis TaxID=31220 RepID=UPI0038B69794
MELLTKELHSQTSQGRRVMAKRRRKGESPTGFTVHMDNATYSRWRDVGVTLQLAGDEDIARYLLHSYEKGKRERQSEATLCTRCQSPLTLVCLDCDTDMTQATLTSQLAQKDHDPLTPVPYTLTSEPGQVLFGGTLHGGCDQVVVKEEEPHAAGISERHFDRQVSGPRPHTALSPQEQAQGETEVQKESETRREDRAVAEMEEEAQIYCETETHRETEPQWETETLRETETRRETEPWAECDDVSLDAASPLPALSEEDPTSDPQACMLLKEDASLQHTAEVKAQVSGSVQTLYPDGQADVMQVTPCHHDNDKPEASDQDSVKSKTSTRRSNAARRRPVRQSAPIPANKGMNRETNGDSFGEMNSAIEVMKSETNREMHGEMNSSEMNSETGEMKDEIKGTTRCSGNSGAGGATCGQCGKRFKSRYNVQLHVKVAHTPGFKWKHQCHLCEKSFRNKGECLSHIAAHSHINPHQCHRCGKTFRHKQSVVRHAASCGLVKPRRRAGDGDASGGKKPVKKRGGDGGSHVCELCGKTFKSRRNMRIHIQTLHTENYVWKHKCEFCPKTFRNRGECVAHSSTHDNVKLYLCCHCGKSFRHKQSLTRHGLDCGVQRPRKVPRLDCEVCHKEFRKRTSLVEHVRALHKDEARQCMRCGQCFIWRNSLRRHLQRESCTKRKRPTKKPKLK